MKTLRSILSRLPLALGFAFLLAMAAAPARAQYVYGITGLQLDPDLGRVYGYSATALDYTACYYYDAAVVGTLYEGSTAIDGDSYHGICTAEVYTEGYLNNDRLYTEVSEHYIIAYYYYYYYGYYDPYGFFGFSSTGGSGFNYYGCYCPGYFAQSNRDLGSTRVSLYNQGACTKVPTLGPAVDVTRGNSATFTISNLCPQRTISGWKFSDGTNPAINGPSSGDSWSGTMVTSGTVSVNVHQNNQDYALSKTVTVKPRSNFAFTAKSAEKKVNGEFYCSKVQLKVPDPPVAVNNQETFGQFSICLRSHYGYSEVGSGPNAGYYYITSVTDSDSGATPPDTTFAWTITPQLEQTESDLYRAQCGRDGYISGAQLRANTVAHESGTTNSHYSRYVAAQNKAENNVKAGLEAFVKPPSESTTDFETRVGNEISARTSRIIAATKEEPCGGSDVSKDESCTVKGVINLPPYRPCSPMSLSGSAPSQTRIDLTWTDGSFNETGFRVERRDPGSPTFYLVADNLPAGSTSYSDTSVAKSQTYVYRVVAFNTDKTSPYSNEASVTTPGDTPPPQKPSNLQGGAASATQITIWWTDDSSDEQGFKIERSTAGGAFVEIASVGPGVTSYADANLSPSTTYAYQVRAFGPGGYSDPSTTVTVTTMPPGSAPAAPCCIWGQAYNGMGSVTISWSDLSNNEDGFSLERNDGWGFYSIGWLSPNTTTWTDYGLQQGQTYIYRVVAENAYGQSFSEEMYYYQPYWWEY
jgi:hypothetical protein